MPATISAPGPAAVLTEEPISTLAPRDLVPQGLCRQTTIANVLSAPFQFPRKVRQFGWAVPLAHSLHDNRRTILRWNLGLLDHGEAFRAGSKGFLAEFLSLPLRAPGQLPHFFRSRSAAQGIGQRFQSALAIPLRRINHAFGRGFLKDLLCRLEVRDQLPQHGVDPFGLDALGQPLFHFIRQRLRRETFFTGLGHLLQQLIHLVS